jgi:Fur family ferric uptake transcriptional regulator
MKDIKKAGLKVTLPRVRILDLLRDHAESGDEHHLSAEDVYRALLDAGEEIGLATVYRVLNQFESAGLVNKLHFEGGQAVYEISRDEHHDHIVCLDCGRIEEFVDETIERRQEEIANDHGFDLGEHSLVLYGRCQRSPCPHAGND